MCRVAPWEFWGRYPFFLAVTNLRGKLCQKFFQKQSQSAVGHNTDPVSRAAPKWLTPPHFVVPDVKKRSCPASCCNGVSLECCATRYVTTQTQKCRTHRTVLQYCPMFKKKRKKKEKNVVACHVASSQLRGVRGGNTLTSFLAKKRFVRCE